MFGWLFLVPPVASLILGVTYLVVGRGRPSLKAAGAATCLGALYLQFGSRHWLAGLLLQTCLALWLAGWRKVAS